MNTRPKPVLPQLVEQLLNVERHALFVARRSSLAARPARLQLPVLLPVGPQHQASKPPARQGGKGMKGVLRAARSEREAHHQTRPQLRNRLSGLGNSRKVPSQHTEDTLYLSVSDKSASRQGRVGHTLYYYSCVQLLDASPRASATSAATKLMPNLRRQHCHELPEPSFQSHIAGSHTPT